jgi:hypothetical protein
MVQAVQTMKARPALGVRSAAAVVLVIAGRGWWFRLFLRPP